MTPNWSKSGPDGGRKAIIIDAESSGTPRALDMRHQGVPAAPLHLAAIPVAKSAQRFFDDNFALHSGKFAGIADWAPVLYCAPHLPPPGPGEREPRCATKTIMAGFAFKSR